MPSSPPSSPFLLHTLVKICATTTSLHNARRLHSLFLTTTLDYCNCPFVSNYIISMYARCGSLARSFILFNQMPIRTTVSFNLLISALSGNATRRHTSAAFSLFRRMRSDGLPANGHTFAALLRSSPFLLHASLCGACHGQVLITGFSSNPRLQTCLLTMYSDCGDIGSTNTVFYSLDVKNTIFWNSIISGNMKNSGADEGLRLYRHMVRSGVTPTEFTYSMALSCCSRMKYLNYGQAIHALVITSDEAVIDLPLQNALLDMYLRCGAVEMAHRVFSRMHSLDIVTWNSMISGCSDREDVEGAVNLFNELRAFSPEKPDEHTFASVICACRASTGYIQGKAVHAMVQKAGLDSHLHVATALVSMYFRKGEAASAQEVFSSVPEKDEVLMTEMVCGYSSIADSDSAMRNFHELVQEGHQIDGFALTAALGACADSASLRSGEVIHCRVLKTGMDVEMAVCGGLIDMYAKGGSIDDAECVFSCCAGWSLPDIKCWNSIIGGYSNHGRPGESLRLLEEIKDLGEVPDEVTMLSVLVGCSHRGLVDEGRRVWEYMKEKKVKVGHRHYCSMVSLLSRAGMMEEAHKVIMESPFTENRREMWRSVLSSLGEQRGDGGILKLDEGDVKANVLLSNVYAGEGMWEKVDELRRRIRWWEHEKEFGFSWIETKGDSPRVFCSGNNNGYISRGCNEVEELHRLQGNMIMFGGVSCMGQEMFQP